MNPIFDIVLVICIFSFFLGVNYLPYAREALRYDGRAWLNAAWYILGILTVYNFTNIHGFYIGREVWLPAGLAVSVVVLYFWFAGWWQTHGRKWMPRRTTYAQTSITFYDYTPAYAFCRAIDIFFQGVVAAVVIHALYQLTGSILATGLWFGVMFFAVHAIMIYLYGVEVAVFLVFAAVVAGTIPVVLLLRMNGGLVWLYAFHLLVWITFLLILRRVRIWRLTTEKARDI